MLGEENGIVLIVGSLFRRTGEGRKHLKNGYTIVHYYMG